MCPPSRLVILFQIKVVCVVWSCLPCCCTCHTARTRHDHETLHRFSTLSVKKHAVTRHSAPFLESGEAKVGSVHKTSQIAHQRCWGIHCRCSPPAASLVLNIGSPCNICKVTAIRRRKVIKLRQLLATQLSPDGFASHLYHPWSWVSARLPGMLTQSSRSLHFLSLLFLFSSLPYFLSPPPSSAPGM